MSWNHGSGDPELSTPPVRPAAVQAWASFIMALAIGITRHRGLRPDTAADLAGYGWVGLLEATLRFDARAGVPFPGYAYQRVIGAMLDGIRRMSPMPRSIHLELARRIPDRAALAEAKKQLKQDGAEALVYRPEGPDMPLARSEEHRAIHDAVASLDADEQQLIMLLFGLGRPQLSGAEVARRLQLHRSRVSRRRSRALDRLRKRLNAYG